MEAKKQMISKVRNLSLIISLIAAIISFLIFKDKYIAAGIVIGTLTGLIGFNMIVSMAYRVEGTSGAKTAVFNYLLRYLMYGCIFALCMMQGIHALALLAGFICHKIAIFIYSKFMS